MVIWVSRASVIFSIVYCLPAIAYATNTLPSISITFGSSTPTNFQFYSPSYIEIPIGGALNWVNNDVVPHSVTFIDPILKNNIRGPDYDVINPNSNLTYYFMAPGVYEYHCVFYPFMAGRVVVKSFFDD